MLYGPASLPKRFHFDPNSRAPVLDVGGRPIDSRHEDPPTWRIKRAPMTTHVVARVADERHPRGTLQAAALAAIVEPDQFGTLAIPTRLAVADEIGLDVSRLPPASMARDL